MIPVDLLAHLQAMHERGDCAGVCAHVDQLNEQHRRMATVARLHARALGYQGYQRRATEVLDAQLVGTSVELLLAKLDRAALQVPLQADFQGALQSATQLLKQVDVLGPSPLERAEAERTWCRIVLKARVFFEVSARDHEAALKRLLDAADVFEATGRLHDAWITRVDRAARLASPLEQLGELDAITRAAATVAPAAAGEARLRRALLLYQSSDSAVVRAELDSAEGHYLRAGHLLGPVDVDFERARIDVKRNSRAAERYRRPLRGYQELDRPASVLNVLFEMSACALKDGNFTQAEAYHHQLAELADAAGLGLARSAISQGLVILLVQRNHYRSAIQHCLSELESNPPAVIRGAYYTSLANGYAGVGDRRRQIAAERSALHCYQSAGAEPLASAAVMGLANALLSARTAASRGEAVNLLTEWVPRDVARGEVVEAAQKHHMIADAGFYELWIPEPRAPRSEEVEAIERSIGAAEALLKHVNGRHALKERASNNYYRAKLALALKEPARFEEALFEALELYETGGYDRHVADCQLQLGFHFLNQSNREIEGNFGRAEELIQAALNYYVSAGLRDRAADCRFALGLLYSNASLSVRQAQPAISEQMLDAAMALLSVAQDDFDIMRRAYAAPNQLEAQDGKRALVAKGRQSLELGLRIVARLRRDEGACWQWVQRAKSRALADHLGGAVSRSQLFARLQEDEVARDLLVRERQLLDQLETVPDSAWYERVGQLNALHAEMSESTELRPYLRLRLGFAPDRDDVLVQLAQHEPRKRVVCVDWFVVDGWFWVVLLASSGELNVERVGVSVAALRDWLERYYSVDARRFTLKEETGPTALSELSPLLAPLGQYTEPDDVLVLAPTRALCSLPLHALTLDGAPLIARNPLVYTPSLSVLLQCLSQRTHAPLPRVSLFGDPGGDRPAAAELVRRAGERFGVDPLVGDQVTLAAVSDALSGGGLFHFQGHARHVPEDPLQSYLELAGNERLTAQQLFSRVATNLEFVALAACESALSDIEVGDEPTGLVPAFLCAGARTVLGTQWTVPSRTTTPILETFYDALGRPGVDPLAALRGAMLEIRANPKTSAPYYWAGLVLFGDWRVNGL